MAKCTQCGGPAPMFTTICNACVEKNAAKARAMLDEVPPSASDLSAAARAITLSTEMTISDARTDRLGIVTGTCIFGQHIGKDILGAVRDVVGGRATRIEAIFKDARNAALDDLRSEALRLGADAVLAVQITHQEITGPGNSMVMVTATGTAVKSGLKAPLN